MVSHSKMSRVVTAVLNIGSSPPVMATKRPRGPPTGQTPRKPPKAPKKASENAEGSGWTTSEDSSQASSLHRL